MTELAKIVLMQAHPTGVDRLGTALRRLVTETREEPGCVRCTLHSASEQTGLFMVYERWQDDEAFAGHMASAHVAAFLANADDLLAAPADVQSFNVLF